LECKLYGRIAEQAVALRWCGKRDVIAKKNESQIGLQHHIL
jgi:hypothetical protein